MRNTQLLTGVSIFALGAALAGGAWAHGLEINSTIQDDAILNAVGVDGNLATGNAKIDISAGNNDIGAAIGGVWLGQVVVNAINIQSDAFGGTTASAASVLAASMTFANTAFQDQIASFNNFNTAVNAVQQTAITITVGVGQVGGAGDTGNVGP